MAKMLEGSVTRHQVDGLAVERDVEPVGVDESLLVDERWGYALSYQLLGRGGHDHRPGFSQHPANHAKV